VRVREDDGVERRGRHGPETFFAFAEFCDKRQGAGIVVLQVFNPALQRSFGVFSFGDVTRDRKRELFSGCFYYARADLDWYFPAVLCDVDAVEDRVPGQSNLFDEPAFVNRE